MGYCTDSIREVSRFLIATESDPDSIQFQIALVLDLTTNSFIIGVMDYLHPYVLSPLWWGVSIMLQSPSVYYDYYIGISPTKPTCSPMDTHHNNMLKLELNTDINVNTNSNTNKTSTQAIDCHTRQYLRLPPTRDACLLRAALEAGKIELSELKMKLRNELIRQNEGLLSSISNKKKDIGTTSGAHTLNAMVKQLLGKTITDTVGDMYGKMFTYIGISNLYSDNLFDSNDEYEQELFRLQLEVKGMESEQRSRSGTSNISNISHISNMLMKWLDSIVYSFLHSMQSITNTIIHNFFKELTILFGDKSEEFQWLKSFDRSDANYYKNDIKSNSDTNSNTNSNSNSNRQDSKYKHENKKWYDIDFGSDAAWQVLYDNSGTGNVPITPPCISKIINKYNYEFCFFKSMKQNGVNMGTFDRWEYVTDKESDNMLLNSITSSNHNDTDNNVLIMNNHLYRTSIAASNSSDSSIGGLLQNKKQNKQNKNKKKNTNTNTNIVANQNNQHRHHNYNYQIYSDGDSCQYNGLNIKRTTHVYYYCSNQREGEIIDIRELETCIYSVLIYTPFACSDEHEQYSLQYLDYLGVFGFH